MWRAVSGGNAGEAERAEVSILTVLKPAVSVWGGGAADFAVGGW